MYAILSLSKQVPNLLKIEVASLIAHEFPSLYIILTWLDLPFPLLDLTPYPGAARREETEG